MSLLEPSDGIFDTPVDMETIERGLRRGLRTTSRCGEGRHITRIGENQGFFSRVGVLNCEWPDRTDLPSQIVIKMTTLLNTMAMNSRGSRRCNAEAARREAKTWTAKAAKLRKWHNNEVLLYETIKSLAIQPSAVPQMYYGRKFDNEEDQIGFICMEYVSDSQCQHVYEYLQRSQISQILRAYASIQREMSSIPLNENSKFTVQPYEELYADILNPEVLSFRLDELRSLDSTEDKELDALIRRVEEVHVDIKVVKHVETVIDPIFIHGDLYSPNLMWNKETGNLNKIIDWQLCHFGNPAEDLTRLLLSSMKAEERRNHWMEILSEYHEYLHSDGIDLMITVEQLKSSYREFFPIAALAFLGTLNEVYRASTKDCEKSDEEVKRRIIVGKAKAILEDILYFVDRKQG